VTDRVPSDHASVRTVRAALARAGGTRRPCLRLPGGADGADGSDGLAVESGDLVRLVLDGRTSHARVDGDARGLVVRGAYDNRRVARERDGRNRLVEWAAAAGLEPGDAVEVDEVEPRHLYGVRVPGRRAVYEATSPPDDSLASIAERLDGEDA
jgi:hypothetical protein